MEVVVLFLVGAALVAYWALGPRWLAWRRSRLVEVPFPEAWRRILRQRVPLVARLPADLQLQLRRRMQVFIAEVPFVGCQGLVVNDEMRVVVAAQACLLLLNRPGADFVALRQVLLYPGPFRVQREASDEAGVRSADVRVLSGESWAQGQVILSWPDCLDGAADPADGVNVVIHEFAHQLDQEDGHANGAPPGALRQRRWSPVFREAFASIQRGFYDLPPGAQPLFDDYALSEPAEFFACACEVFFERGGALEALHPELYAELARFFRTDTSQWQALSAHADS